MFWASNRSRAFLHALQNESLTGDHGADGLFDGRPLRNHPVTVRRANNIQVNVDRKPWNIEQEQVQRSATLECQPVFQKRVCLEGLQQAQPSGHLFQQVRAEAGRCCLGGKHFVRNLHSTSPQVCSRTSTGTTRFHAGTRRPGVRRPRSR